MTSKKTYSSKTPTRESIDPPFATRDADLPASQGMLYLVRTELKAEMRAGFKEVDARFKEVDARFNQVDARFNQIDARFDQMDARFDRLEAQMSQMISEVSRIAVNVEEQNARNRVVMDGLANLWQRQDRVESRVGEVEKTVQSIARFKSQ
jgi:chromosome segregation ATPase